MSPGWGLCCRDDCQPCLENHHLPSCPGPGFGDSRIGQHINLYDCCDSNDLLESHTTEKQQCLHWCQELRADSDTAFQRSGQALGPASAQLCYPGQLVSPRCPHLHRHKISRITVSPTGLCHGRCHSSSTVYSNISFTLMLHYRATGSIVPVLSSGRASLFKDTKNPCTEKKHLSKTADYIMTEKVMKAEWYRDKFHGKVSPCDLAPHTEKPAGEGRIWCQQGNSMVSDKNTGLLGLYKICFCNKNVSKITLFIVVHKGAKWY